MTEPKITAGAGVAPDLHDSQGLAAELEALALRLRAAGSTGAIADELEQRLQTCLAAVDRPGRSALAAAVERIGAIFDVQQRPELAHGLESLTQAGGMPLPGGLTLVTGERALVAAFGVHLLDLHQGKPGLLYCTGEQRADDLWFSLLLHRAGVNVADLADEGGEHGWRQLTGAAVDLESFEPWIEPAVAPDDFEAFLRRCFQVGIAGRFPVHGRGRACRGIVLDTLAFAARLEPDEFARLVRRWADLAGELALPIVVLGAFPGMRGPALPDVVPPEQSRPFAAVLHLEFEAWPATSRVRASYVKHPRSRFVGASLGFDPANLTFGMLRGDDDGEEGDLQPF